MTDATIRELLEKLDAAMESGDPWYGTQWRGMYPETRAVIEAAERYTRVIHTGDNDAVLCEGPLCREVSAWRKRAKEVLA